MEGVRAVNEDTLAHPDNPCEDSIQAILTWLKTRGPGGQASWVRMFEQLRNNPQAFHESKSADPDFPWDIDELCMWQRAFHYMTPIADARYAREMLLAIERSGVPVPPSLPPSLPPFAPSLPPSLPPWLPGSLACALPRSSTP